MLQVLDKIGLQHLIDKIKHLPTNSDDETIGGNKTFSNPIHGDVIGNVTGNVSGSANSANKLTNASGVNLTVGSATVPTYFNAGVPAVCTGLSLSTSGNAATATKWANSRKLTLTGDVTGNVSFDGSAAIPALSTTISNTAKTAITTAVKSSIQPDINTALAGKAVWIEKARATTNYKNLSVQNCIIGKPLYLTYYGNSSDESNVHYSTLSSGAIQLFHSNWYMGVTQDSHQNSTLMATMCVLPTSTTVVFYISFSSSSIPAIAYN